MASRDLAAIDTTEARFYKGIADLMRGDGPAAVAALGVVRASGQQPYARESQFYLGKAALQRGDVAAAQACSPPLVTREPDRPGKRHGCSPRCPKTS